MWILKSERGWQKSGSERFNMRTILAFVGFGGGRRGPGVKEYGDL